MRVNDIISPCSGAIRAFLVAVECIRRERFPVSFKTSAPRPESFGEADVSRSEYYMLVAAFKVVARWQQDAAMRSDDTMRAMYDVGNRIQESASWLSRKAERSVFENWQTVISRELRDQARAAAHGKMLRELPESYYREFFPWMFKTPELE